MIRACMTPRGRKADGSDADPWTRELRLGRILDPGISDPQIELSARGGQALPRGDATAASRRVRVVSRSIVIRCVDVALQGLAALEARCSERETASKWRPAQHASSRTLPDENFAAIFSSGRPNISMLCSFEGHLPNWMISQHRPTA